MTRAVPQSLPHLKVRCIVLTTSTSMVNPLLYIVIIKGKSSFGQIKPWESSGVISGKFARLLLLPLNLLLL